MCIGRLRALILSAGGSGYFAVGLFIFDGLAFTFVSMKENFSNIDFSIQTQIYIFHEFSALIL